MDIRNLEEKKLRSEIFKNWVTTIAVAIAGIWAVFLFCNLQQSLSADVAIKKTQAEIAKLSAESYKTIEFKLELESSFQLENESYGAVFSLTAKNTGIRPIDFSLTNEELFTLTKIGSTHDPKFVDVEAVYPAVPFNRLTKTVRRNISGANIAPGTTQTYKFYVVVPEPGVYFASALVEVPMKLLTAEEQKIQNDLKNGTPIVWGSQAYVRIPEKI